MSAHGVISRTMEDKVPLSILYLGRRGGGAKITKKIEEDLHYSKKFSLSSICIRKDNEEESQYDQSKVVKIFDTIITVTTPKKIFQYALVPSKLLSDMRLSADGVCLVPMISPLGLVIEGLLKTQGVKIIRLLHDFEKHPGDKWPPNFLTRRIIKHSNFLIALSEEVAKKIKNLNPKIKLAIYPHPVFDFSNSQTDLDYRENYILFIGRIRKYKGVENLVEAFNRIEKINTTLIIAGEGKLRVASDSNIRVINRWLGDREIASLINNAEVVVFPYIEASQSGLLPYCVSKNKKVVITPLPGLLEQTMSYRNVFVTQNFDAEKLSFAINAAIEAETIVSNAKVLETINIELSLLDSGLFD
jgi:glycosyltransferase involved in cell wall biosynthesis